MPKEAAYIGGPGMMIFQSVGRRQDRAPSTSRAPWAQYRNEWGHRSFKLASSAIPIVKLCVIER